MIQKVKSNFVEHISLPQNLYYLDAYMLYSVIRTKFELDYKIPSPPLIKSLHMTLSPTLPNFETYKLTPSPSLVTLSS